MEKKEIIRPGKPQDKTFVARLMIQAMEDLASKFVNDKNPYAAIPAFEYFYEQPSTLYSYENTLVFEDSEGKLVRRRPTTELSCSTCANRSCYT
jgi:hypothetical protein